MQKGKLVMLAAHEPSLDPRIDWEASLAAKKYRTVVVGLQPWIGSLPSEEEKNGYTVIRLERNVLINRVHFFRLFLNIFIPSFFRSIGLLVAAALTVILFPVLLITELPFKLLKLLNRSKTVIYYKALMKLAIKKIYLQIRTLRSVNKVNHFFSYIKHFYSTSLVLLNCLESMDEKPQVVHCNDLDTLLVGIIAKRIFNCKVIYDAHEFWPYSDVTAAWYHVRFFKAYERRLIKQADHIFTVNPLMAEQMAKTYHVNKILSLPNCAPITDQPISRNNELSRIADGRLKFLLQGNFAPGRGIEELIKSWYWIDGQKAVLFLRGPDNAYRQSYITLARDLGMLNDKIFFMDPVDESKLVAAAMEADIGIIPYRPVCINNRYCCPNKLSQYMQAGIPIVSNNLVYVKEIIQKYECGLNYDSDDEKSAVELFNYLIENREVREKLSQNAKNAGLKEFNWQVQSKCLSDAYDACFGEVS